MPFTNHSEKSPTRKLTRTSLSTETKLKSNVCFFCYQKEYTTDEKQPKGLTLSRVTKLNGDELVRSEGLLTVKTVLCNELVISVPGNKYMLKVIIRNTRKECEIYSNLTIKTQEQRQSRHSGVFIVDLEHISLVFLLLTLNKYLCTGLAIQSLLMII